MANFKERLLKFRAWDAKNKRFPFVGFHLIGEVTAFDLLGQYRLEEYNDLVITQFTGLQDKNGKDIYEGDILNISRSIVDKARVVNTECHISEVFYRTDGFLLGGQFSHRRITDWNTEIIGNVFESPKKLP